MSSVQGANTNEAPVTGQDGGATENGVLPVGAGGRGGHRAGRASGRSDLRGRVLGEATRGPGNNSRSAPRRPVSRKPPRPGSRRAAWATEAREPSALRTTRPAMARERGGPPTLPRCPAITHLHRGLRSLQPGLSAGECHPGSQLALGVQRGDGELSTGVDVRVCMWIRGVFPRHPRSLAAPSRRVLQRT